MTRVRIKFIEQDSEAIAEAASMLGMEMKQFVRFADHVRALFAINPDRETNDVIEAALEGVRGSSAPAHTTDV